MENYLTTSDRNVKSCILVDSLNLKLGGVELKSLCFNRYLDDFDATEIGDHCLGNGLRTD